MKNGIAGLALIAALAVFAGCGGGGGHAVPGSGAYAATQAGRATGHLTIHFSQGVKRFSSAQRGTKFVDPVNAAVLMISTSSGGSSASLGPIAVNTSSETQTITGIPIFAPSGTMSVTEYLYDSGGTPSNPLASGTVNYGTTPASPVPAGQDYTLPALTLAPVYAEVMVDGDPSNTHSPSNVGASLASINYGTLTLDCVAASPAPVYAQYATRTFQLTIGDAAGAYADANGPLVTDIALYSYHVVAGNLASTVSTPPPAPAPPPNEFTVQFWYPSPAPTNSASPAPVTVNATFYSNTALNWNTLTGPVYTQVNLTAAPSGTPGAGCG